MSKVLISFLGTGPKENDRGYKTANYQFADGSKESTSFVAAAIKNHVGVDKLILIGTVKSMWEEVYRYFSADAIDENYYCELGDYCAKASHKSELQLPEVEKIEEAIGNGSKVLLINYGLNEDEIIKNQEVILGVESLLSKNDEIYIDITHSFRSLPLYLLNAIIYLQNVSAKKVNIADVYYGMLDITRELGYTPVVSLKQVVTTNEWISGAYSFKEFGNAYKISKLLEKEGYRSASNTLNRFSDAKNLNYSGALQKLVQEISALKGEDKLPEIAKMIVNPVIEEYRKQMSSIDIPYKFQYNLAKWHFNRMNFSSSYLCLTESIVSYVCEMSGLSSDDKDQRDEAKKLMFNDREFLDLCKIFNKVNPIRKQLAHSVVGDKNIKQMISILEEGLKEYEKIINSK